MSSTPRRVVIDVVAARAYLGLTRDLNMRQADVLCAVSERTMLVRELALLLMMSKPAVSRAVDRLGMHGFTYRSRDGDHDKDRDLRDVYITITAEGRHFLKAVRV